MVYEIITIRRCSISSPYPKQLGILGPFFRSNETGEVGCSEETKATRYLEGLPDGSEDQKKGLVGSMFCMDQIFQQTPPEAKSL